MAFHKMIPKEKKQKEQKMVWIEPHNIPLLIPQENMVPLDYSKYGLLGIATLKWKEQGKERKDSDSTENSIE